ncbi:uracil-5--methyltransferase TRM9 [Xylaria arbuscula]|nr:uracil-5--methyltransferase TRM9 [Xylaria arbuscula]
MSCPTEEPSSTPTIAVTATTTTTTKLNAVREAAAQSPETYEDEHVHSVYESIASHFSSTRYKPWPFIASFLRTRVASGAVGLDVGCGNGKYLGVREGGDVHMIGSDRSPSLVSIARGRGFADVAVADGLALPFRTGCADFVLCIAVIHHMSTRERRVDALRRLLACARRDGGQVLVYVWALEQSSSRRGWDANSEQDQLVPWVMKANQGKKQGKKQGNQDEESKASSSGEAETTYERFYHLYREGELEEDMRAAGGKVIESGYERDNWWVIGGHGEEEDK